MADLMHPYRRPYRADTATVEVKFLTPETAVETRSKTCWHGFSAEHVHITKQKQYSYEWCGATHYLALHDLQLKDGELQVAGQTHRPTDLRQKMSFIPRDCSATGWAEPEKRGNSFMAIYFDPEVMSKDLDSLFFPIELMPIVHFDNVTLRSTIEKIRSLLIESPDPSNMYAETIGVLMAIELLNVQKARPKRERHLCGGLSENQQRKICEYIDANLSHDISLVGLAEVVGLSRFHLIRAFKKSVGVTPYRYVLERRVERAKYSLTQSRTPIQDIASETGFHNSNQLARAFRQVTGIRPRDFRSLHR